MKVYTTVECISMHLQEEIIKKDIDIAIKGICY